MENKNNLGFGAVKKPMPSFFVGAKTSEKKDAEKTLDKSTENLTAKTKEEVNEQVLETSSPEVEKAEVEQIKAEHVKVEQPEVKQAEVKLAEAKPAENQPTKALPTEVENAKAEETSASKDSNASKQISEKEVETTSDIEEGTTLPNQSKPEAPNSTIIAPPQVPAAYKHRPATLSPITSSSLASASAESVETAETIEVEEAKEVKEAQASQEASASAVEASISEEYSPEDTYSPDEETSEEKAETEPAEAEIRATETTETEEAQIKVSAEETEEQPSAEDKVEENTSPATLEQEDVEEVEAAVEANQETIPDDAKLYRINADVKVFNQQYQHENLSVENKEQFEVVNLGDSEKPQVKIFPKVEVEHKLDLADLETSSKAEENNSSAQEDGDTLVIAEVENIEENKEEANSKPSVEPTVVLNTENQPKAETKASAKAEEKEVETEAEEGQEANAKTSEEASSVAEIKSDAELDEEQQAKLRELEQVYENDRPPPGKTIFAHRCEQAQAELQRQEEAEKNGEVLPEEEVILTEGLTKEYVDFKGNKRQVKISKYYPEYEYDVEDLFKDTPVILRGEGLDKEFVIREGLFKRTKIHAVKNVDFFLREGETLSIVGESGSGKTTLAKLITNIESFSKGKLFFKGQEVNFKDKEHEQQRRKEIQVIFQNPHSSLNPRKTIFKTLEEPLILNTKLNAQERREKIEEIIELIGLKVEHLDRLPHMFSGGQKQRIAIARGLILNPSIVVADEAVSALDVSVQAQILNLMLDLQKRFNLSYLFISHDLAVVRHVSHRIMVMYHGEVVETGTVEEIFNNPQHPYTKSLLAAIPKLPKCAFESEMEENGESPCSKAAKAGRKDYFSKGGDCSKAKEANA